MATLVFLSLTMSLIIKGDVIVCQESFTVIYNIIIMITKLETDRGL